MQNQLKPFCFTYARGSAGISLPPSQTLSFSSNQVIWLVGESGSGKSTLLHLLKGFYPEFLSGQIEGNDPSVLKKAMYMAQNSLSQIVHERVGEEFFFTLENANCNMKTLVSARDWLARFDLVEKEFTASSLLSHGLAQRLILASLLAAEPTWLLLDEPTAFLNPDMRDDLYKILKSLKNHVGMVLIDHHPQAAELADICWHINSQGIISEITVEAWMVLQANEVQHEIDQPTDNWQVPTLTYPFELSAKDVEIGYKGHPLFTANFSLKDGECAVLTGENGAGKSTLFNTLAGMQKPLSGQFKFCQNGQTMTTLKKNNTLMAYVFQHPDSHFYFDTIAEDLAQLGVSDIETTLTKIGLPNTAMRSPHQLSEGQKRRLTLLYPCLQSRPLVLLDEPTFGQDAINALRITRLILALKHAGHTIIVITHDETLHDAIADQMWTIKAGKLHIEQRSVHA